MPWYLRQIGEIMANYIECCNTVRDIVREINNVDRMQGTLKQLDYPTIDNTPITTNLYSEINVSLERYKEILLDTKINKGG